MGDEAEYEGALASGRRSGLTRRMDYRLDIGGEALMQLRALPRSSAVGLASGSTRSSTACRATC